MKTKKSKISHFARFLTASNSTPVEEVAAAGADLVRSFLENQDDLFLANPLTFLDK